MSESPDLRSPDPANGHSWRPIRPVATVDSSNLPGGKKSLSAIATRAFLLGIVLGISLLTSLQLCFIYHNSLWRAALFISILSAFHYLEFDTTARYNTVHANVSAFLLSGNGWEYTLAHTTALLEFLLRQYFTSQYAPSWLPGLPFAVPPFLARYTIDLGLVLIGVGQPIRTLAMMEAGRSFNHIVQHKKQDDHALITTGVYHYIRHPSYAGYFWWALGTQLMLGNVFCFFIYAAILWKFFSVRIQKEELSLIAFFGQDYKNFRDRTPVYIPFIR